MYHILPAQGQGQFGTCQAVHNRQLKSLSCRSILEFPATVRGPVCGFLPHQAYPLPVQPAYAAPNYTAPLWGGPMPGVAGTAIGVTIKSYSKDFVLSEISLSYRDVASVWG